MPPKAPKAAPGKKGAKAPNAMIAKLKMKMEQQKEEEDRLKREEEELERQAREEERLLREQAKKEAEEKKLEEERKKLEERQRKKEEKKKVPTKALERFGPDVILPDLEKIRREAEENKGQPRPVPKPKKQQVKHVEVVVKKEEESDGEKSEPTESDMEVDEDDWEALADREERREKRHENNLRIRKEREERRNQREEEKKRKKEEEDNVMEKVSNLRSPICCVLGHVDAGKTSLLDRIRSTNVQGGEAGGITQQIGATFVPYEALVKETEELNKTLEVPIDVPGLLIIDTPGHESFTNLRSRGSSLCDIAILVVDINNGLQKQTLESIRLLKERKCPFVVACNKVDSLYKWKVHKDMDIQHTLELQEENTKSYFADRVQVLKNQLAAEGLNSELYYYNDDVRKTISIVPLSAKTGEGISDLILLSVKLVQKFMEGKVTYKNEIQCTVLEVKPIQGHGVTADVILINGVLHEGDEICLCGQGGPIFTQIRYLMTPQPLRESRVKGDFVYHKEIKAAMGIKIAANDLEHVIPGTQLLLVRPDDDREELGAMVMKDASNINEFLAPDGNGVTVQSSTLGALEALLSFLKDSKIPVANAFIGPMHKRHILQVLTVKNRLPRYAVVLAFDTVVTPEAREIADKNKIPIFEADVIYHLFDRFIAHEREYDENEKKRLREIAVYPVQLKIGEVYHNSAPIICGVRVQRGQLHLGTPLCFKKNDDFVEIGRISSIQKNEKDVTYAKLDEEVTICIDGPDNILFGRHFDASNLLESKLSRPSVDAIKTLKHTLTDDDINFLATLIKDQKVPK